MLLVDLQAASKPSSVLEDSPPSALASGDASNAESHRNNYHRAGGQNVGNFLTGRNTSRVLAPPGGQSQISFG